MRQPPALKSQPRERLIACTGPSRGWRINFAAKPVIAPPQAPRETIQVKAISPDRDACEIRFPGVEGYRVELPEARLTAVFEVIDPASVPSGVSASEKGSRWRPGRS